MTRSIRSFGAEEPGQSYRLRPGGYALIRDPSGNLAVILTDSGMLLPGGGQDGAETPSQAAVREVVEEAGLHVEITACVGVADQLVYARSEEVYYRKRETFFLASVVGQELSKQEAGHLLQWIPPRLAYEQLSEAAQRWALGVAWPSLVAG